MIIEIKVPSERVIGMKETKVVEITDEEIVKLINRYFELNCKRIDHSEDYRFAIPVDNNSYTPV